MPLLVSELGEDCARYDRQIPGVGALRLIELAVSYQLIEDGLGVVARQVQARGRLKRAASAEHARDSSRPLHNRAE